MTLTSVRPYVFHAGADLLTVVCAREKADGQQCIWRRDFNTAYGAAAPEVLEAMGEHSLEHSLGQPFAAVS